jgi:hypothetical protein
MVSVLGNGMRDGHVLICCFVHTTEGYDRMCPPKLCLMGP